MPRYDRVFLWGGLGRALFLCVAFADVAGLAEGLEVGGVGGAAFAEGFYVIDMEDGAGLGGRGSAAGAATEVVGLHDEVAGAPGDVAVGGGCFGAFDGWKSAGFAGAPLHEVLQGFEPGAEYAEVWFAAIAGVWWNEVGRVGLAAEGGPQVGEVVEEWLGADAEFFSGLQACADEGVVPRAEFTDVDGGVVVSVVVVLTGCDGLCGQGGCTGAKIGQKLILGRPQDAAVEFELHVGMGF